MVIGRIMRVEGVRVSAVFYERMQPFLVSIGNVVSSPRINSFVKTGVGLDVVVCQIVGEHEAEYDRHSEVAQAEHVIPDGGFVVDLEVRGHIVSGTFKGGLRCLPIVGATVETLEGEDLKLLYSARGSKLIKIGHNLFDETNAVYIDAGRLMASHIGVFGNTGSGKSNTLASILNKYVGLLPDSCNNAHIMIFDLNNEYGGDAIVSRGNKTIYQLNTHRRKGETRDRIPLDVTNLDVDSWGTILRATQKTQMPVVRRAFHNWRSNAPEDFVREVKQSLVDKRSTPFFVLRNNCNGLVIGIENLAFHNKQRSFYYPANKDRETFIDTLDDIHTISIKSGIEPIEMFYLWLALEVAKAAESGINYEFVQPLLARARSVVNDLEKLFIQQDGATVSSIFRDKVTAVVQLGEVNEGSREMLPSLLSELIMVDAAKCKDGGSPRKITTIVIDEAHNLLGYDAAKTDLVHDNTLRVFERVIKEGRKFGVFLCLASQRPSDISPTITSQIHNYFIHKLVNPNDIERIRKTVSFMGEGSLSMLSVLGQGECIVSGPSLYMPQYVYIERLAPKYQPNSSDLVLFGDDGILDGAYCPF